jgi:hypothetical protein
VGEGKRVIEKRRKDERVVGEKGREENKERKNTGCVSRRESIENRGTLCA